MGLPCWVTDLGCCDYGLAHRLQLALVAARRRDLVPDVLLLCSHPPVFTAGRATAPQELAAARAAAALHHLPVATCERGGRVTYHGPGQILAYPVLALQGPERDLHGFLRLLEAAVLRTLADLGVDGRAGDPHAGVWVGPAKIAALGVAVRGWITYHGLALNLGGDREPFGLINPCGVARMQVTTVEAESASPVSRARVQHALQHHLLGALNREGSPYPAEKLFAEVGLGERPPVGVLPE